MSTANRQRRAMRSGHGTLEVCLSQGGLLRIPLAILCAMVLIAGFGALPPARAQDVAEAPGDPAQGAEGADGTADVTVVAAAEEPAEGTAEEPPPLVQAIEGGVGYSEFTRSYGDAHYLFARYSIERPYNWRCQFDVGSQARFDDNSLDFGASFTKFLWGETHLTLGASSGTGDYIAPEYRLDVSLAQPIVFALLRLGYTREQSKAENYRDGFGVGLERWFPHWIVGAHWRYDLGYPGKTISRTVGFGLTYFTWERFYIGVGVELGDVSYMQVGPTDFLVNYDSESYELGISYWLTSHSGVNFKANYGKTDFYEVTGIELGFFRRW